MEGRLIVGTMSGTSADGVDAAVTRITGRGLDMKAELILHHHNPYDPALRREIFAFRNGDVREDVLGRLANMGRQITLATAAAVNESLAAAKLPASEITAIAAHGQTLFHNPPDTIQWLDPALLAHDTNCTIVSDFRRADLAAGGQGAPLVPFADYILFRHAAKNRILLNIGGIANITSLPANCTLEQVVAFDTGPGNCISDWVCRTFGPLDLSYDVDGVGASRGQVSQEVADHFLADAYFTKKGPKSADGPAMIAAFQKAIDAARFKPDELNDLLATASYLTARTIHESIKSIAKKLDEVIASGGGTQNKAMMAFLRARLAPAPLNLTDDNGIHGPAKEALAFALLAAATLDGIPSNIPTVTGASHPVVLGSITPKP